MNLKKSPTPAIERAVAKSVNFEISIADLARRSERRAWWVAFSAIGMSLILAGGYFYMLPLKQKVPYLVMADAYTGTATVAHLTGNFGPHGITSSEAINRSNVAHFVLARESYDLAMLNLRDWKTVQTMASPGVKAEYTKLYSSMNEDSLYKQYGKDRAIRIKLLSIVLLGGGPGITPRGATVRFQRSLFNKTTGATQPMDSKIATIEFTYKPNLDMDDQSRIENPLGFWVTSYRVDNDYAAAPPAEVTDSTVTAPATPTPAATDAGLAGNPEPPAPAPAGTVAGAAPR
ncbi:virB8 family protein [Dyella sp. KULCS107]|uniref:virB8 family protein n=1 Tax=Dyella sp. KULCS107 TaxID=3422216 RepID=UPI003D6E7620